MSCILVSINNFQNQFTWNDSVSSLKYKLQSILKNLENHSHFYFLAWSQSQIYQLTYLPIQSKIEYKIDETSLG